MAIHSSIQPAATPSLKPRYPSPPNRTVPPQSRRFSGSRRSVASASTIPLFPNAESPRTLCPRDHVAFAYDPSHLKEWEMPQDLWEKLPPMLQASVAAVQHAGAAVLTGFDRLERAHQEVIQEETDDDEQPDDSPAKPVEAPKQLFKPVQHERQDSGFFSMSDASASGSVPSSNPASPDVSPFELPSAQSPFPPADERMFNIPSSPKSSYYLAELSHLRCESMPRLRHSALRVNVDLNETRRVVELLERQGEYIQDAACLDAFDDWWKTKKPFVSAASDKVRALVTAVGVFGSPVMGWSGA